MTADVMKEDDVQEVANPEDCYLAQEYGEIAEMDELAKEEVHEFEIVWKYVFILLGLHIAAAMGILLALYAKIITIIYAFSIGWYMMTSITAGAHRLWTHKAFKANFGVRLFLMIGQSLTMQNYVIKWARNHRCHHKWTDSDADPHNINRGFFFAHMGWLMLKKHPKVFEMGKKIDMSDLEADPMLAFQKKYFLIIAPTLFAIVSAIPFFLWNEHPFVCFFTVGFTRLVLGYHGSWVINSAAHSFGYKPFDTKISAVDNGYLATFTGGEGWHNYHHAFPQDYRASEFMWKNNTTAMFLDFCADRGWVWDRKLMSKEALERQKEKCGDHSRPIEVQYH